MMLDSLILARFGCPASRWVMRSNSFEMIVVRSSGECDSVRTPAKETKFKVEIGSISGDEQCTNLGGQHRQRVQKFGSHMGERKLSPLQQAVMWK